MENLAQCYEPKILSKHVLEQPEPAAKLIELNGHYTVASMEFILKL